jgi:hypothetical protein
MAAARCADPCRVLMHTCAPCCASARAVASPIESAPQPVTTQVLPNIAEDDFLTMMNYKNMSCSGRFYGLKIDFDVEICCATDTVLPTMFAR